MGGKGRTECGPQSHHLTSCIKLGKCRSLPQPGRLSRKRGSWCEDEMISAGPGTQGGHS